MKNLALNQSVTASDISFPYMPSKAVNGAINPFNRWQSNTVPCWLEVNLGTLSFVNRWVVRHLPVAGWQAPNYVNSDFELQASMDERTWRSIDRVENNTQSVTDRSFKTCQARFFRIFIRRGFNINPQVASIVELEIYQAPELLISENNLKKR